jgi:hypothetical protein
MMIIAVRKKKVDAMARFWDVPQRQFASTAALPFSDDSPSLSMQEPL